MVPIAFIAVAAFSHPFAVSRELLSLSIAGINSRGGEYDVGEVQDGEILDIQSWNWNGTERPHILLVGSSHASSLARGLAQFSVANNLSLVSLARSYEGVVGRTETNGARLRFAREVSPQTVVLFSHWSREVEEKGFESFSSSVRQWSEICENLIVIESPPQITIPPQIAPSLHHYLVHLDLTGRALEVSFLPRDTSQLEALVDTLPNTTWVNLVAMFSRNGKSFFLPNGAFPYADLYHLNHLGIKFLLEQELGGLILSTLSKSLVTHSHELEGH